MNMAAVSQNLLPGLVFLCSYCFPCYPDTLSDATEDQQEYLNHLIIASLFIRNSYLDLEDHPDITFFSL